MTQADSGATVIDKVVRILDVLGERGELGLSRLAVESGLAKSTVYRLCADLDRLGLVKRGESGITLGNKLVDYADLASADAETSDAFMPVVADLYAAVASKTVVAVHVAVADTVDVVRCVAQLAGSDSHRTHLGPAAGERTDWRLVAEGWVIGAFWGSSSMSSAQRRRVDDVRRKGFATQRYDGRGGRTGIGVAVPIDALSGRSRAALAVDLGDPEVDFRLIREVVQESIRASAAMNATYRPLRLARTGPSGQTKRWTRHRPDR